MEFNLLNTTRLLLVRHGEASCSEEDTICGTTEVPLTTNGHFQARCLAERLRKKRIDILYSSPQQRALETAAPIAATLGLMIHKNSSLRELDFGKWENRLRADLEKEYSRGFSEWKRGSWMAKPGEGETQQDVIARVVHFLIEILPAHTGETILVVSHKVVLRLLIGHVLEMPLSRIRHLLLDPASLTELCIIEDKVELISFNDTSHLATERAI